MKKLLIVSNGHGEDWIAARVGSELLRLDPSLHVEAFPLVGVGKHFSAAGIRVAGPRQALPSGGFTMHAPDLLFRDLRAGLLRLTAKQVGWLRAAKPAAVFTVGDFYAQAHSSLVRAPRSVLQPLISAHHFVGRRGGRKLLRYFMEDFRGAERRLLRAAGRVYARDERTATWLRDHGVDSAVFLGNPMMDGLTAAPLFEPGRGPLGEAPIVALLPGSRAHAEASSAIMAEALTRLGSAHGLVAWTGRLPPPVLPGWQRQPGPTADILAVDTAEGGRHVLWWVHRRFAAILRTARAVLATAGTATEQAVGLGLPAVVFPVPPLFTGPYLDNQVRLLGRGLLPVPAQPSKIAHKLRLALNDPERRRAAREAGLERMGTSGGSAAIALDLLHWLTSLSPDRDATRYAAYST